MEILEELSKTIIPLAKAYIHRQHECSASDRFDGVFDVSQFETSSANQNNLNEFRANHTIAYNNNNSICEARSLSIQSEHYRQACKWEHDDIVNVLWAFINTVLSIIESEDTEHINASDIILKWYNNYFIEQESTMEELLNEAWNLEMNAVDNENFEYFVSILLETTQRAFFTGHFKLTAQLIDVTVELFRERDTYEKSCNSAYNNIVTSELESCLSDIRQLLCTNFTSPNEFNYLRQRVNEMIYDCKGALAESSSDITNYMSCALNKVKECYLTFLFILFGDTRKLCETCEQEESMTPFQYLVALCALIAPFANLEELHEHFTETAFIWEAHDELDWLVSVIRSLLSCRSTEDIVVSMELIEQENCDTTRMNHDTDFCNNNFDNDQSSRQKCKTNFSELIKKCIPKLREDKRSYKALNNKDMKQLCEAKEKYLWSEEEEEEKEMLEEEEEELEHLSQQCEQRQPYTRAMQAQRKEEEQTVQFTSEEGKSNLVAKTSTLLVQNFRLIAMSAHIADICCPSLTSLSSTSMEIVNIRNCLMLSYVKQLQMYEETWYYGVQYLTTLPFLDPSELYLHALYGAQLVVHNKKHMKPFRKYMNMYWNSTSVHQQRLRATLHDVVCNSELVDTWIAVMDYYYDRAFDETNHFIITTYFDAKDYLWSMWIAVKSSSWNWIKSVLTYRFSNADILHDDCIMSIGNAVANQYINVQECECDRITWQLMLMCATITKYRQAEKEVVNVNVTEMYSSELKHSVLTMSIKVINTIEELLECSQKCEFMISYHIVLSAILAALNRLEVVEQCIYSDSKTSLQMQEESNYRLLTWSRAVHAVLLHRFEIVKLEAANISSDDKFWQTCNVIHKKLSSLLSTM